MQDCSNSCALAKKLLQSCSKPSRYALYFKLLQQLCRDVTAALIIFWCGLIDVFNHVSSWMQNENDIFTQFNNERIEIAIRFEYYNYISWWIVIWRNQLVALKNTKHQILLSREKKIKFVQIEQYIQCNENDLKGSVLITIFSKMYYRYLYMLFSWPVVSNAALKSIMIMIIWK